MVDIEDNNTPIQLQQVFNNLFNQLNEAETENQQSEIIAEIMKEMVEISHLTSAYICRWFAETLQSVGIVECLSNQANYLECQSDLGKYYTEDPTSNLGKWLANTEVGDNHINLYDLPRTDADRKNYLQYGACSLYHVRIQINKATWGYLELWESRYNRDFTENEQAIFHYVAGQFGKFFATQL